MKTDIKLIKIAGVDTPDFNEPKGEAYEQAMKEINHKVETKRVQISKSITERNDLKAELVKLNNLLIMEDDPEKQEALLSKRKEIQDELDNLIDYSGLDINVYAKKLINEPEILKLKHEADEEVLEIISKAREYEEALTTLYNAIIKETRSFTLSMGGASGSSTRRVNVKYNQYLNS